MSEQDGTLADMINASGMTFEDIARRGGVSGPFVSSIVKKGHLPERPDKITGLAKGLGVSARRVREAIARSPRRHPYREPLADYEELSDAGRAAVRELARVLREQERKIDELSDRIQRAEQLVEAAEQAKDSDDPMETFIRLAQEAGEGDAVYRDVG